MVNDPFTTPEPKDAPPEEALAVAHAGGPGGWLAAALPLDRRLESVARRPGDATLTRLRLAWWTEAVATLGQGSAPVDPVLVRLAPLLKDRPDRLARVDSLIARWDERVGEPSGVAASPLAGARAALLLDGADHLPAQQALEGRALIASRPDTARVALNAGLEARWPRALRAHRLLARAALHRLEGGSERALALRLLGWALTGR